jgi:hypothetical protein
MALSCVVLLALLFVATQSGNTSDEPIERNIGKYSLKYYMEGDTTFTNYTNVPKADMPFFLKYYGSGYEIFPAIIIKYFDVPQHEYLIRHLLCAFFGFLFMLFAAFTARELKNWLLACITLLIMVLTPTVFGLSMIATKDIPYAAGFAIAIFAFIRIFKRLPRFRWQDVLMAIGGVALATSVRIGGLLLLGYLGVGAVLAVAVKSRLRDSLLSKPYALLCKAILVLMGIALAGSLVGLCFYPNFFHEGHVVHIQKAFSVMSEFPQRILMLWEGEQISSLELPDGYLIKSFFITTPVFALAAFFLFFVNIRAVWKAMDKASVLLLLFTVFFPIIFILYKGSNVYNGWRHLTFIYSSVAVVAAVGIYQTLLWVKNKSYAALWKCVVSGVMGTLMASVLIWMVGSYKYCYAYYNVFVSKPHLNYDMDYYELSCTVALRWLVENELKNRNDTVTVGVKNPNAVAYARSKQNDTVHVGVKNPNIIAYARSKQYGKVKVSQISYHSFAEADVDYAIVAMAFIPPNVRKGFFPPRDVIHTEYINGTPFCVVVKKNKLDCRGIRAMQEGRVDEGIRLLEEAYAYDPKNFGIWFWMGYGYFHQQQYDKAIRALTSIINLWPHPYHLGWAKMYLGASQVSSQQVAVGIQTLKEAEAIVGNSDRWEKKFINAHLGIGYFNSQDYAQAIDYMKKAVDAYPYLNAYVAQAYAHTADRPPKP